MKIERQIADAVFRNSFGAFCYRVFEVLSPGQQLIDNWHIDTGCYVIERMVTGESAKRLALNQPPRTLKSHIASVCLPAWVLGQNPGARIICASYSEELARKFSRDCRALMESPFYRRVFPRSRLNPKKSTETEFETTRRGYRLATSVGGTLTGRGGDILIVDDPIKANDANSEVALTGADEWFHNTALSRLDSAESLIILAMQRLHQRDLSGILIERGWPSLVLPAIATETQTYLIGNNETYTRQAGELLQPQRDTRDAYESKQREVGTRVWTAQYQQNPVPAEGNMIKAAWLARYDFSPAERKFCRFVLSCDPAGKAGIRNDYTAITICGSDNKEIYLLHVSRGHWTVLQMRDRIQFLAREWNVDAAIIEDASSGMGLVQMLREETSLNVIAQQPKGDKETRLSRHEGRFEAGHILLPKEAPWLPEFESELLGFPNAKHDDQVDALVLALDYFVRAKRFPAPMETGLPYVGPSGDYDHSYDNNDTDRVAWSIEHARKDWLQKRFRWMH
jgi:predicted phage terminase large subunit-like protein